MTDEEKRYYVLLESHLLNAMKYYNGNERISHQKFNVIFSARGCGRKEFERRMKLEYIERMKLELEALQDKVNKLGKFIDGSDVFTNLDIIDRVLLQNQLDAMIRYMECLQCRLDREKERMTHNG